jgi:group I intron endonuclease
VREYYSGIYHITLIPSGKQYIGSAINIDRRFSEHRNRLRSGRHENLHLQNAWNKYGEDSFIFGVLETITDKRELVSREQYYIDTIQPEFNMCSTAGSTLGRRHSEDACAKMSASRKGRVITPEWSAHLSAAGMMRKHTEEEKRKISEAHKGKPKSETHKQKLAAFHRGLHPSDETKRKMGLAHKGQIKLIDESTAEQIRTQYSYGGITHLQLAALHGVSSPTIYRILHYSYAYAKQD